MFIPLVGIMLKIRRKIYWEFTRHINQEVLDF